MFRCLKRQMLPRLICLNPIIPSKTLPHLLADGHNSIQSRTPLWFQRHLLYIHFSSPRSLKNYAKKSITAYLQWEGRQFNSIRFLLSNSISWFNRGPFTIKADRLRSEDHQARDLTARIFQKSQNYHKWVFCNNRYCFYLEH